ncbi:DnaB-like helicase N-terminal domain-containing protein [Desertimonas flava]|uniref:DnaB-like helicase N-terminal domain-containing protein n=1 Tax=Desertimonas flava TaxID=2064846 RepID=UPI000E34533E|nr:DnaB-like helicase N-terminal domain-containing protein [Desertimonas flava]
MTTTSRPEPPHALDAEGALLGCLLLGPAVGADPFAAVGRASLDQSDFHSPSHRLIFDAICQVYASGDDVDVVTVAEEMRAAGTLDAAGGLEALHRLQNATPSVSAVGIYVERIADTSRRRRLITAASELSRAAWEGDDRAITRAIDEMPAASRTTSQRAGMEFVDWDALFSGVVDERPVVDEFAFRGRWTALAAKPKTGKSTLLMHVALACHRGEDPFEGGARRPLCVMVVDPEMGRLDVLERLCDLGLTPADLVGLHYTDIVPKLDTAVGAGLLLADVDRLGVDLLIIDGINGAVDGPENDDTTWRPFYDLTIAPLKRRGVAIVTTDNAGHGDEKRARGSSVKVDKPDAAVFVSRTDHGVKLTTTHRRTAAYAKEMTLVIRGADGSAPISYHRSASSWPAGTEAKARELDELDLPREASNRDARAALKAAGRQIGTSEVLAAALRYRRTGLTHSGTVGTPTGTLSPQLFGTQVGQENGHAL